MAKVGVRIEGSETLSPAANSATKSLRALKEETEGLKKSAQNILQPLINIRSTLVSVAGAAGLVQIFRGISREIGEAVDAFAKADDRFGATVYGMKESFKSFKTEIGGLIAEIAGPLMETISTVFGAIAENMKSARNLRDAVRDVASSGISTDAQRIEDQLTAVLKQMIEIINLQDKGLVNRNMVEYYDAELRKLNLVRIALLDQKEALQQIAAVQSLVSRMRATGAEAASLPQKPTRDDFFFSNYTGFGPNIPDREAPGYEAAEIMPEAAKWFGVAVSDFTAFNSQDEWAQVPDRPYVTADLPSSFVPLSNRDSSRGSGGLEQAGQINSFNDALMSSVTGLGGFVGGLMNSVATMGPLGLLYEALKPVIEGILQVLGPAIGDVLAPLLGAFVIIGQALGQALLPILQALTPVFEILGMVVAMLAPVIDALARPVEFVADLLGWLAQWLRYGIEQLRVFFYNLAHPFAPTTSTVSSPGGFTTDAFTRPITTVTLGDINSAGGDYLEGIGGTFGGGYGGGSTGGGSTGGGSTSVQQMPDIYVYLTVQGNVIGAGGATEVGETMARALEAYAGIGGRIHIEGALA